MSIEQAEIILIACVTSAACVLPGVFLVLRKVALMSDAISHAILMGIVLAFFVTKSIHSPLLIVGAVLVGVLTVTLTELVIHSRRLKEDAAIGLIFPLFFSIGVILINLFASNVHLDEDAVLLGELAFAPFNRWVVSGVDMGPISLWVMGAVLVINIVFIGVFYKELKLSTFDKAFAHALGLSPALIHYGLMSLVSVTAVGAFDAVGSILVVALMITPPATAYLLTHRLSWMLGLSVFFGILAAILGYGLSYLLDASIAGSIATMAGGFFVLALLFSPQQGLVQKYLRLRHQRLLFSTKMLLVQLLDHEGTPQEKEENSISNMVSHMGWAEPFARQVSRFGIDRGYIIRSGDLLQLTPLGREMARQALVVS